MRKTLTAVIAVMAMMAFFSCDQQKSAAQRLVKEFLDENLVSTDYKVMSYSRLDSTKLISDSVFMKMRNAAADEKHFKVDMQFADGGKTKKLNFIRVKYRIEKDTVQQTFYLDDQLTRVVAFKEN